MRRLCIGMLGPAAVLALALPTTVRPVSAAGTHICTVNTSPCPAANQYGTNINVNDTWHGSLASANATFSSALGNIVCTVSNMAGKSASDGTGASLTAWSFNDGGTPPQPCTTTFAGNPTATITVNSLPSTYSVTKTTGTNWDGTLTINNLNLTIAPSTGPTCTATATSLTGNLYNKGNANAPVGGSAASHTELDFPGVSLSESGTFCPTTTTFTATYYVIGDNPANTDLFVTT